MDMSMESLNAAVAEVVKKISEQALTEEKLSLIFTDIMRKSKKDIDVSRLPDIIAQAKNSLQERVMNGVGEVIDSYKITESLSQLKEMIKESSKGTKGWRPTGVPDIDIQGHLQAAVNPLVQELEKQKIEWENKVQAKRAQFQACEANALAAASNYANSRNYDRSRHLSSE